MLGNDKRLAEKIVGKQKGKAEPNPQVKDALKKPFIVTPAKAGAQALRDSDSRPRPGTLRGQALRGSDGGEDTQTAINM